jgi:hypothetical protein
MNTELSIIPQRTKVLYGTYAQIAVLTATLKKGDLGYASDRNVLYRWSGTALVAITISSRHGNIANIGDPANYPESSLYQADDEEKLYMVVSAAWSNVSSIPVVTECILSDTLRFSNDAEVNVGQMWYLPIKSTLLGEHLDKCRVKYDAKKTDGSSVAKTNIYQNPGDNVKGTIHELTTSYQTFSEDFQLNWLKGWHIAIYGGSGNNQVISVKNFRFYYDRIFKYTHTSVT